MSKLPIEAERLSDLRQRTLCVRGRFAHAHAGASPDTDGQPTLLALAAEVG